MKNNNININIIVSWLILNKQKKNICYLCFSIKDHFSFAIFRFESPEKSPVQISEVIFDQSVAPDPPSFKSMLDPIETSLPLNLSTS